MTGLLKAADCPRESITSTGLPLFDWVPQYSKRGPFVHARVDACAPLAPSATAAIVTGKATAANSTLTLVIFSRPPASESVLSDGSVGIRARITTRVFPPAP